MQNLSMFPGICDRETELEPADVEMLNHANNHANNAETPKVEVRSPSPKPLVAEQVDIERIARNERVNGPLPVREEGDTVIVPVGCAETGDPGRQNPCFQRQASTAGSNPPAKRSADTAKSIRTRRTGP